MPLRSLVKWSGGKRGELAQILQYLPASYETYVEPFAGGAALFFHLEPACGVLNDTHSELINFYRTIQTGSAFALSEYMATHPNEEAEYYRIRSSTPSTPTECAARFYYLRKNCYRGMSRYNKKGGFNVPYGRYKTFNYSALTEPAYTTLLARTTISNDSFEAVFARYNDPSVFMFLDPPYDSPFSTYSPEGVFGREEHERLAQCFRTTKCKCLMVIGCTPFIEALYRDYIVARYPKKYRFKLHSGRVGTEIDNEHLVIRNY